MFPDCIIVDKRPYCMSANMTSISPHVRFYDHNSTVLVCKMVRLFSGELFFHTRTHDLYKDQRIFVAPLRIIYDRASAYIVYPFSGNDAFELAQSGFWMTYEHITLSVMEKLIDNLDLFHTQFLMAMGDIKPENIVYNNFTGIAKYIDLEYASSPGTKQVYTDTTSLTIDIPDPRTRYYRTTTTIAYTSFEKRLGGDYSVFQNDQYALATTLFCLLTNRKAPGLSVGCPVLSEEHDRVTWNRVHTLAFDDLVSYVNTVLGWSKSNTNRILMFIRDKWLISGPPLLST
jgi:serine/threonine protein kinase